MRDFDMIKSLVGDSVTEDDLKYVDCYVHANLGLFIPSVGPCLYAKKPSHTHPSYMFVIVFSDDTLSIFPNVKHIENHYLGAVLSPDIPHEDYEEDNLKYYCILIQKEYFEEQLQLYTNECPSFKYQTFYICHDILKALNTFAFEYSKQMKNSHITLHAQATIITHWLIRSLLGENYDMRAISSNYTVARIQQYMEQHYGEHILVEQIAKHMNLSVSSINRIFKKETNITPIEYLIEIRIQKSKKLLMRKDVPITEIALRCGFSSSAHFASCFKCYHSMTPSEYRQNYSLS